MKMRTTYMAYGLRISSEIQFPQLAQKSYDDVDLSITLGAVPSHLTDPEAILQGGEFAENELLLSAPGIGRFHVCDGKRITVEPAAGADMQSLHLHLLGSCAAAILHQRQETILHASCVTRGATTFTLCGTSGAGKSTTAASFVLQGYSIISDDVTLINLDNGPIAVPSYPQGKLFRSSLELLNLSTDGATELRLKPDKFARELGESYCDKPKRLDAIVFLTISDSIHPQIRKLNAAETVRFLHKKTFRKRFIGKARLPEALRKWSLLAEQVPAYHLTRPSDGNSIDEVCNLVEGALAGTHG